MSPEFSRQPQNLTSQKQHLQACFNLPTHDYQVERVFREVNRLFASQELQQRILEKRQPAGKKKS
jgi:hypothetical protein